MLAQGAKPGWVAAEGCPAAWRMEICPLLAPVRCLVRGHGRRYHLSFGTARSWSNEPSNQQHCSARWSNCMQCQRTRVKRVRCLPHLPHLMARQPKASLSLLLGQASGQEGLPQGRAQPHCSIRTPPPALGTTNKAGTERLRPEMASFKGSL